MLVTVMLALESFFSSPVWLATRGVEVAKMDPQLATIQLIGKNGGKQEDLERRVRLLMNGIHRMDLDIRQPNSAKTATYKVTPGLTDGGTILPFSLEELSAAGVKLVTLAVDQYEGTKHVFHVSFLLVYRKENGRRWKLNEMFSLELKKSSVAPAHAGAFFLRLL